MNGKPIPRTFPITVPRDADDIMDLLVEDFTRVLIVGRTQTEAIDLFEIVVDAARSGAEDGEIAVDKIIRVGDLIKLRTVNGSTLKVASAAVPSALVGHAYDVVLLAPHVTLSGELATALAATLATSRGGVIAWLPAVA